MLSTLRLFLASSLLGLVALAAAGQASAQTAVSADATVWQTAGVPADNAVRLTVRIADPSAPAPGVAERITAYLPAEIVLDGSKLPTCSLDAASASGPAGCPTGSQVGSGRASGVLAGLAGVGAATAPIVFDAYLINGAAPGELIAYLAQVNGGAQIAIRGSVTPSDDAAYGSMVTFEIPAALRHPVLNLDHAITELDLLLGTSVAAPYVRIAGCPLGTLPFKALVAFDPSAATVPPGPLQVAGSAVCMPGPPPALVGMPRPPASPPGAVLKPERAVPAFGVKLKRAGGAVRRLRLSGVPTDTTVSARCLRRCGRPGAELIASVRGSTARLKRPLRKRSRFELRVGGTGLVTRFARYQVDPRAKKVRRIASGCLDEAGAVRACPAAG